MRRTQASAASHSLSGVNQSAIFRRLRREGEAGLIREGEAPAEPYFREIIRAGIRLGRRLALPDRFYPLETLGETPP
uniref:Uncharacterized protein n=1 Tax=Candidatus Kentrum eta TaxID=2126337 RepID=A0A450VDE6_9GAMM|nr:MAG: hypothetical protein BECKH772A_GA0070896_102833 [Candidatus Kentron sp. H]VFK02806.1 MAG: hypothetical protein BECKH772B_GA0070898_103053 [Candidatus Kentron sp. H]VFK05450.1 MAG: hypothetical protein BECKH772C_GA0070978_102733 [Candidatus Kentron sp. H]